MDGYRFSRHRYAIHGTIQDIVVAIHKFAFEWSINQLERGERAVFDRFFVDPGSTLRAPMGYGNLKSSLLLKCASSLILISNRNLNQKL